MSSRKQRRRRAKERRHEYEYVYVDEEGQEVEPPPEEAEKARNGKPPAKAVKGAKAKPKAKGNPWSRPGARPVPPPSWQRVIKRGAIFAPLMFLTITLISSKLTVGSRLIQTAYLLILFIPFSYLIDRMMYRRYLRQTGQLPPAASKRGRQS